MTLCRRCHAEEHARIDADGISEVKAEKEIAYDADLATQFHRLRGEAINKQLKGEKIFDFCLQFHEKWPEDMVIHMVRTISKQTEGRGGYGTRDKGVVLDMFNKYLARRSKKS